MKKNSWRSMRPRSLAPLAIVLLALACSLAACGHADSKNSITVLNYGKYLEPSMIEQFEEETGIRVEYEEYVNPEEMYTKYKSGAIDYDLICTSDYMLERLIQEGEAKEIHFENIPLSKNLDSSFFEFSKAFDPENKFTLPYFFGTVGLLYDKDKVDEAETKSWNILWDEKYKDQIIMENSVRDTFLVPLKLLGYSSNSTDEGELREALDMLIDQKPLVYSYLVDESADEVVAGNAAIALVYSGEAAYAQSLGGNIGYSVPEEGSNMWIDSWLIPKTCKNQENAEKFLDFLCREDVGMTNFEYVYYATPNNAVKEKLSQDLQNDKTIFPDEETLDNCEIFHCLDDDAVTLYNNLWKELKSE